MLQNAKTGFLFHTILLICTLLFSFAACAATSEGIQVYQGGGNLSPEHKQKLADDITRYRNADNLWDVLRDEFSLPHYEDNPIIQEKIEWYMNNQDYLLRSATRAAPYLYYISQQVKKRHLPAELVLLPIIESGYNPLSTSPVGAAGVWQLMPDTASGLGIRQDWSYDGRRDVIASTRAALNYLAYLQSFFEGNWLLAIAAYNTGEGNVLSAIRRNIRDGRDTDFWSLPVARETRDYVPMLLALAVIISHPDRYPVYFPPVRNAPYLGQVDVGSQISLKYAAQLAGISYSKIVQLNPGYNRHSTSKSAQYKLVLPIENVEQFTDNLTHSPLNPPIDWTHYRVKPGDTLASVSKKFKMTASALRRMNHLSASKNSLRPGTSLLIPNSQLAENDDDSSTSSNDQSIEIAAETPRKSKPRADIVKIETALETEKAAYTLQPGDTIYMVRTTDNIDKIAKRFHVGTEILKQANSLRSSKLVPGKQIIIPTHFVAAAPIQAKSKPGSNKKIRPGDTIYMVRKGDTIEKIAHRFHTSPAAIRITNLVDNSSISEGDKLVIPTHIRG